MQRRTFIGTTLGVAAATGGGARVSFAQGGLPAGLPDYYPSDYGTIIEASRNEPGLLVYSNMAEYNWRPVIEGFNKLYPWLQVQTLDLSSELFERYYAEKASNTRTSDLIVTGAIDQWIELTDRGEAVDYVSAEADKIPDWAKPRPGLYTASTDPLIICFNKQLLPEDKAPKSIADLAELARTEPSLVRGRMGTYNAATSTFGLSVFWAYLRENPDAWQLFDVIGPMTRPEVSAGPIVEKVTTGEYVIGYFVSGIVLFPRLQDQARARLIGWNFIEDGTPVFMRGMAVAQGATSPNASKLMLDFILSHQGQVAFGQGGLTPYRPDVKKDEVPFFTYQAIVDAVGGQDKIVLINYDREMVKGREDFVQRWRQAYNQA